MTTKTAEQAREYIGRGWTVVPVPCRKKGPQIPEWQKLRITPDEVAEWFVGESNIGVLLGEPSGGLVDIDLDCDEAEHVGKALLTSTLTSGRGSRVRHYWCTSPSRRSYPFKDTNGDVLVEIRGDQQTLVAASLHPSGDLHGWINTAEPREIEASEVRSAAARVAAASLIARHLPDTGRHDLALAYAELML
jgi:hypothetical protein